MGKNPNPQDKLIDEARPETEKPAPPSPPISFEEPAAQLAEGVAISDEKPADFVDPVISDKEMAALQKEAALEDKKRDFFNKIQAARTPKPEPEFVPPPLAPRVMEQTNAELEAGRALVAKHEALQAARRPAAPPNDEAQTKPVFRPGDYVPDQKKGQGYIDARTL